MMFTKLDEIKAVFPAIADNHKHLFKELMKYTEDLEVLCNAASQLLILHHDSTVMNTEWGEQCPACVGRLRKIYEDAYAVVKNV